MHDILLSFPAGQALPFDEVQERLRASEAMGRLLSDQHSTPEQVVLVDPDTGVHAILTPGGPPPPDVDEEEEAEPAGDVLLFQIPYLRPGFFAQEAAAWAQALADELGCAIEGGPDVVRSWQAGNRQAIAEASEPPEEGAPPTEPPRAVPAAITRAAFENNRGLTERQQKAGVEMPRLVMAVFPLRKDPALVGRYTAGEPVWLPDAATHLLLERQKKTWLGTRREELVVEADAVRRILAPFEKAGEAPAGMRAYRPTIDAADPAWQALEGTSAKSLAVLDWAGVVDEEPGTP